MTITVEMGRMRESMGWWYWLRVTMGSMRIVKADVAIALAGSVPDRHFRRETEENTLGKVRQGR